MEVLKLAAGFGEPCEGRLLNFDLRDLSFTTLAVARRPGCAACGSLSLAGAEGAEAAQATRRSSSSRQNSP